MRKQQVIIFDLDGTAVDSPRQKLPSVRLSEAVKKLQKNYPVCAATGRPWAYASPVLRALGLTEPCIISGGTQICEPQTGRILWQSNLEHAVAQQAAGILKGHLALRQHPGCRILLNDYSEDDHFNGGIAVRNLEIMEPVHIMTVVFVPDTIVDDICAQFSTIPALSCSMAVAQGSGKDLHITNKEATKEHAVATVLELLGLETDAAIGVGDGYNDLHLFNAVRHRVAMGNAVEELKRNADQVIGHVKEDGLAAFFEHLCRTGLNA